MQKTDTNLKGILSDTFSIYMMTYAVHWNYCGTNFYSVHKMTEQQYTELNKAIDDIAERLRAMKEDAPISLAEILDQAQLKELKSQSVSLETLTTLAKSHRNLSKKCIQAAETAEEVKDFVTHDMLVARAGIHDKFAWMLESYHK
ncbi:MAG: Dps family protein [Pseudobdellovibrio sp.]